MTDPARPPQSPDVNDATSAGAPRASSNRPFRDLYDQEFAWVMRTLRRLGARDRDLEDLAHDVFIVVFKRLADYDPSRPLRPWLFGIAFRVVSDYRRRAAFSRETPTAIEQSHPASAAPAQEAGVVAREQRELVLAALDALDLDQRAVFVLHELDGASIPEIAANLDVSHNTLYSRLRLARGKFTAAVQRLRQRGTR